MKSSRLRPKVVIWWGIALSVVGALLVAFLPAVFYQLIGGATSTTGVDQGLLSLFDIVLRTAAVGLPPLGPALIGAGLVMLYLEKNAHRDEPHSLQLRSDDAAQ
jgi:hypothetical protein